MAFNLLTASATDATKVTFVSYNVDRLLIQVGEGKNPGAKYL
jgi:hypothetical protein